MRLHRFSTRGAAARFAAFAVAVSLASAYVPRAYADPTAAEIAAARELFEEGLKLEDKGQWSEALERFRKVSAVKSTPQVRFHIALCLENMGKLVDALVEFQGAASADAGATNVTANAGKHVTDLKERIPRVIIKVPAGVEGTSVTIDGNAVTPSLVGTAIPLDPGAHKLSVSAPKRTTFNKDFDLKERDKPITIDVALPEGSGDSGDDTPPPKDDKPAPSGGGGGAGPLPWVFGGIGVAALAGGGVMFLLRQNTIKDLEDMCGPNHNSCPESARATFDKGKTYNTYGNILLGVGALSIATAVVLFVVAPSSEPKGASLKKPVVSVGALPGSVAFTLSGSF
jgi:hypothetical protein